MEHPRINTGHALIPLTQGKFAIVDAIHLEHLLRWKWIAVLMNGMFLARSRQDGSLVRILMHREVARLCGKTMSRIGHLNGNSLDNRAENLVKAGITLLVPKTDSTHEVKEGTRRFPAPALADVHSLVSKNVQIRSRLPFPDLTNQEFGKLVVLGLLEVGRNNPTDLWLCRCLCGSSARFSMPGAYLRSHESWSCGCSEFTVMSQLAVLPGRMVGGVKTN